MEMQRIKKSRIDEILYSAAMSLIAAATSGILTGLAFPPFSVNWLAFVGLTPLLFVILTSPTALRTVISGFLAGFIFFLITLRPLVSAHLWSGWQDGLDGDATLSQQFIVLNILWVALSVIGSLFWAVFAYTTRLLSAGCLWRLAIFAPPSFIFFAEWLRSLVTWQYHWAFLGNALIDFETLRQLSALGGVWLMSWVVVFANILILSLLLTVWAVHRRIPLMTAGGSLALIAFAMLVGSWQLETTRSTIPGEGGLRVGALQHHKDDYYWSDYTEIGIDQSYARLLSQLIKIGNGRLDLLVLPESVAITAVSLDGSRTDVMPTDMQIDVEQWEKTFFRVMDLADQPPSLVLGMSVIENGKLHNSLVYWTTFGLEHVYHKRGLVPLAERKPSFLTLLGLAGESQYSPGDNSRPATIGNAYIGSFICQEVLIPRFTRLPVESGAQILVSGGNDGVFGDKAIREVHAQLAKLRATETGRYIVRAMKTGISAIIDPTGATIEATENDEPTLLQAVIYPMTHRSIYLRFGDWPLVFAGLMLALALVSRNWRHFARKRP